MNHRSSTIRIFLVDDHPILRTGLLYLLERQSDLVVVGQASSGEEALQLVADSHPDVCLLDLSLPGIDGFETLQRMLRLKRTLQVIMLTSSDSAEVADRAMRNGASGFLSKNVEHRLLIKAIREVHAGHTGIMQGVAVETKPAGNTLLTPREMEVLRLMRRGLSNAQIGQAMAISERTVKGHVTFILEKLGAADRAGAVARGFDLGLLKAGLTGG
ncbi:MAG: response regulator transcription factor [Planctomycetia bacterium]|nr:response regulator transcription factor [Planctomycetia bacterium]